MKIKILKEVVKNGIYGIQISFFSSRKDRFGYLAPTSKIRTPFLGTKQNVFIYDNCGINTGANFVCHAGKFILRRNCSVGPNFTVITSNHKYSNVGQRPENAQWGELEASDVIVNEDVWIGANVTLCPGTIIGRGCIVAAGSVCVKGKEYPPYSIIGGNPAKFIKFRLTWEEQLQQEKIFYCESDQLPVTLLKNNWHKHETGNNL